MADNELRDLRLLLNLPVKEMVEVVRTIYPKYDKTLHSKCENCDSYGVYLLPDAVDALRRLKGYEPQGSRRTVKKERHRLTCRISARLEDGEYGVLQQYLKADGHKTMQELLTALVRRYLKEKEEGQ